MTKEVYQQCLAELRQNERSRWFKQTFDQEEDDSNLRPIRNIFKMSRVLVDKS